MLLGAATLFLTAGIAWALYAPLRGAAASGAAPLIQPERERLIEQKERCLQILKDLELDFATKKVSEQDYHSMKSEVSADLGGILEQLDEAGRNS